MSIPGAESRAGRTITHGLMDRTRGLTSGRQSRWKSAEKFFDRPLDT
ncbi:hypothetical protein VIOLET_83 [Mycobacterium phage Violet]|uniref:Uncharacterized protein n=1 Tax=Mycobacterium phage Violet TaxID=1086800 RepID=G3MER8_9CAUD|nr:hypothetical protein VIOLET_83 [Mycobacterium phage Violet]AEO94486.1 hypothetical protein VIOLET_83 [Mycobacterium phage Violet]